MIGAGFGVERSRVRFPLWALIISLIKKCTRFLHFTQVKIGTLQGRYMILLRYLSAAEEDLPREIDRKYQYSLMTRGYEKSSSLHKIETKATKCN